LTHRCTLFVTVVVAVPIAIGALAMTVPISSA
jgi:hypothetical protein